MGPLTFDPAALSALADDARAAGEIALDTEFVGEGRYRPALCLVQLAVRPPGGEQRIVLCDPIEGFDPAPIADLLADPEVDVVLHAGRQDVAILRRTWDVEVRSVFDTQVAAAFLGLGAQIGYGHLVQRLLGRKLEGSATFTRWDRRPLTEEQVSYAREDVDDLLEVADVLRSRLGEEGRLSWAQEECGDVAASSDTRPLEEAWTRLPRQNRLSPRQRAVAQALAAWRERAAAAEDRPVGQIVIDGTLVEAARRRPRDERELASIRGMKRGTVKRHGEAMLAAVAEGAEAEPITTESGPRRHPDPVDGPRIALCEALTRHRVEEAHLAYELVTSRADLNALVAGRRLGEAEPDIRALRGWRRELIGDELLELLDGRLSLAADADGLEVSRRL